MKPRPSLDDETLLDAVTSAIADILWGVDRDDPDVNERVSELRTCLSCPEWDGYQIARRLELDFAWAPNAKLVSTLDQVRHVRDGIYDRRVREWVQETGLLPDLDVGVEVLVHDDHNGKIRDVRHKEGCYLVALSESNRLKQVPYEQVKRAKTAQFAETREPT